MASRPKAIPLPPPVWTTKTELSSAKVGGEVIFATDEWFASADNMLKADEPAWKEDAYTTQGKWMDGWESRRKRTPGHDWCVIKLGIAGVVHGIAVDTAFFSGNYVPKLSIQAARLDERTAIFPEYTPLIGQACSPAQRKAADQLTCTVTGKVCSQWTELVSVKPLGAGYADTRFTYFTVEVPELWTHIRVNMHPDGGIARLKVYGDVVISRTLLSGSRIDLIAVRNGGKPVGWSNTHYGHPKNLLNPGDGLNMGDGWETARRLDRPAVLTADPHGHLIVPGHEWCVIELGTPGTIEQLLITTTYFKGNFPESCMVEGCIYNSQSRALGARLGKDGLDADECALLGEWVPLLPRTKLTPDAKFDFNVQSTTKGRIFQYVRLSMYPDGGIMRFRVLGHPSVEAAGASMAKL